jgi:hypothetical protein
MNKCQPEDMTFSFGQGSKPISLGEMYNAVENLKLAQADLDTLRQKLVDTHEALTMICGLVLDTVGQIDPKLQNEKEKQLLNILDQIGFKVIL